MGDGRSDSPREPRESSSPLPEITFGGTEETGKRALAAVWEIVLREKAKREGGGS